MTSTPHLRTIALPLLILGAGGHARVVARLAVWNGWRIAAILDRIVRAEPELIEGVAVTGPFGAAEDHFTAGVHHAIVAVGDNAERATLFFTLAALGYQFPVLRHPTAVIEENAEVGAGTVVCAGAIVGSLARVGANVIVNTGAIIDHECEIADHAHVAPGCRLAGRVRIGQGSMVGLGTCVREKQRIGARTVIGAGSVVVDDFGDDVIAFGHPARVVRTRET
jgi:sugar O-acyltransferase (sialic acid O-acetyltransferase NeuD family)